MCNCRCKASHCDYNDWWVGWIRLLVCWKLSKSPSSALVAPFPPAVVLWVAVLPMIDMAREGERTDTQKRMGVVNLCNHLAPGIHPFQTLPPVISRRWQFWECSSAVVRVHIWVGLRRRVTETKTGLHETMIRHCSVYLRVNWASASSRRHAAITRQGTIKSSIPEPFRQSHDYWRQTWPRKWNQCFYSALQEIIPCKTNPVSFVS